jgi:DNA-binding transcriptional MerR regulator
MEKSLYELDCFLQSEQASKFSELSKKILEKNYTTTQVGVSHRWITFWDERGLLPSVTKKGKWRKFSFVEYVWLKMIIELRKYNISLDIIRRLKNSLFEPFSALEYIKSPDLLEKMLLSIAPDFRKEEVKQILADKEKIYQEIQQITFSPLYLLVLDAILLKSHIAILVNHEGVFIPFKEFYFEDLLMVLGFKEFIRKSYVSISITEIVSDFIKETDSETLAGKLAILTEKEAEIIQLLRERKYKSLKVRFDDNREISMVDVTKAETPDTETRLIDMIMKDGYHEIVLKTEKGKLVTCENTRKIKLNN